MRKKLLLILFMVLSFQQAKLLLANGQSLTQDSLKAIQYHQEGIAYYQEDQYEAAISSWEAALNLRKKFLPPDDLTIIKGYRNIGNAYWELADYEKSKAIFQNLLQDIQLSAIPNKILFRVYIQLGLANIYLEDLQQAETYLNLCLSLCQKKDFGDARKLGELYGKFYQLYKMQAAYPLMVQAAKKAVEQCQLVKNKEIWNFYELANSFNNLGIAYELIGNYDKAIQNYQLAIDINQQYTEDRQYALAMNYNNITGAYREKGLFDKALQAINKAIALDEGDNLELSGDLNNKAGLYAAMGKYKEALAYHQQSINLLFPTLPLKEPLQIAPINQPSISSKPYYVGSLNDKAQVLQKLATIEDATENLKAALITYDTIAILMDQIRIEYESDESKSFLSKKAKDIYEQAIQTAYKLYELTTITDYLEKAFQFAERSKSLILLEAVKQSKVKNMAGIPLHLQERENALKIEIANLNRAIADGEVTDEFAANTQLAQNQQSLALLIDTLEKNYPKYYQLKYEVAIPSVNSILSNLATNQSIIEYYVGKEHIYIFYFNKTQGLQLVRTALDFPLKDWIEQFNGSIYLPFTADQPAIAPLANPTATYIDLGQKLYQKLLAPVLSTETIPTKLLLIPDGILGYLPFDALLTTTVPKEAVDDFTKYPFLLNQQKISYGYSLTLQQVFGQSTNTAVKRELLAFAPVFKATQPVIINQDSTYLPPIIYNQQATSVLQTLFQGKFFQDLAATETTFKQLASNYACLHIGSHAKMNDQFSNNSFISFTQQNDTIDKAELLFVDELYNLELSAEMVVLSACETAVGELKKGEGIISLARAFSYAGAKSIITTLWQVNDQKTATLVTNFYQHIKAKKPKDEALWLAKKQFIDGGINAHPYFWAGFIPIGDMQAIQINSTKNLYDYLFMGLPFLIVIGFILKKIIAKK